MKGAAKVFNALSIIFLIIFVFWIVSFDFHNPSFDENRSSYFGMVSAILMILALQVIKRSIRKNHNQK